MADENTQEPQDTTPVSETPTPAAGKTAEELQAELDRTAKALKEANKEAATRRKRLEELEAADEQRKKDAMSDTEKLQQQVKDANEKLERQAQQFKDRSIRQAVLMEATRAGFNDPEDALRADVIAAITVNDETGDIEGAKEAIEALSKAKPYLIAADGTTPAQRQPAPSTDAGTGNPPVTGGAALTGGESALTQLANQLGFKIDESKVRERKVQLKNMKPAQRGK